MTKQCRLAVKRDKYSENKGALGQGTQEVSNRLPFERNLDEVKMFVVAVQVSFSLTLQAAAQRKHW